MLQFFFFNFFYLVDLKTIKFCILELALVIIKADQMKSKKVVSFSTQVAIEVFPILFSCFNQFVVMICL